MAIFAALPDAPEGGVWYVVGPFCWGKGTTAAKAYRNARRNLPSFIRGTVTFEARLLEGATDSWISGTDGSLEWTGEGKITQRATRQLVVRR
jgi:hypothetical protein